MACLAACASCAPPSMSTRSTPGATPLRELLADSLVAGSITYFAPYEDVHRENLKTVMASG
jgi:hypothetical protein